LESGQGDQRIEYEQNSVPAFAIAYPCISAHLPNVHARISAVIQKIEIGEHEGFVIE
jgi:hypothetical protein